MATMTCRFRLMFSESDASGWWGALRLPHPTICISCCYIG